MIGFILWLLERKRAREREGHLCKRIDSCIDDMFKAQSKMRSNAVRYGQKFEQMIPLATIFPFNMKDVRFLGSPVDMIIFNGLDEGELKEVVFVEVKTGKSNLSTRERMVRDCIINKKVRWTKISDKNEIENRSDN